MRIFADFPLRTPGSCLEAADALIAAHLATVPKCEHKGRLLWGKIFGSGEFPAQWCLDCGEEVTP
jgi:hypothetical protein